MKRRTRKERSNHRTMLRHAGREARFGDLLALEEVRVSLGVLYEREREMEEWLAVRSSSIIYGL